MKSMGQKAYERFQCRNPAPALPWEELSSREQAQWENVAGYIWNLGYDDGVMAAGPDSCDGCADWACGR